MEQEITQLEKQVQVLIDWKNARKKERLVLPIDVLSRRALDTWKVNSDSGSVEGLFKVTGKVLQQDYLSLATAYTTYGVEVSVDVQTPPPWGSKLKTLVVMLQFFPFTADAGTNFITNTNGQHNLSNGQIIALSTSGTLPAPLAKNTYYYIINRTGNTFQISTSSGGSPVDITNNGSGSHYYAIIQ